MRRSARVDDNHAEIVKGLTIVLPWPPSVNHYWRHVVMGKRAATILSKPGRVFRKTAKDECLAQKAAGKRIVGRLAVLIELYPPDKRQRDVDNHAKAILDALTHAGVWGDDSQVDELRIVRRDIKRGGGMAIVFVDEIGG